MTADIVDLSSFGDIISHRGYKDLGDNLINALIYLKNNKFLDNKKQKCSFCILVIQGHSDSPHWGSKILVRSINTLIKYFVEYNFLSYYNEKFNLREKTLEGLISAVEEMKDKKGE